MSLSKNYTDTYSSENRITLVIPMRKKGSVFFPREKLFWAFFRFFHGQKPFFTPTFWPNFDLFHAHFCFHGHFLVIFSRVTNKFSRAEIVFLYGEFYSFNGYILHFFSRASFWFSRAHFQDNFHGQFSIFTCTSRGFFRFFSRAFIFFTGTNVHFLNG